MGPDSVYKPDNPEYLARKKAILAESQKRLQKLPSYIEKKKWSDVRGELDRYMYETRGAIRGLASTPKQQEAATAFFKAIETCDISAALKKQEACAAAAADSAAKLDAFVATL